MLPSDHSGRSVIAFYSQILYELSRTHLCNFAVLLAAHAAPGAAPRVFRFAPTCPSLDVPAACWAARPRVDRMSIDDSLS